MQPNSLRMELKDARTSKLAQVFQLYSLNLCIRFECPYHGWTYSTSGRLTKAKRLKGIQDFSAKNFSLIPIAVQTWGPFIFINLSSKNDRIVSTDFAEVRNSMENEVGPFDQGMKFVKRVVYDVESNWKVDLHSIYCSIVKKKCVPRRSSLIITWMEATTSRFCIKT